MTDPTPPAIPPPTGLFALLAAMERPIRFLIGMGLMVREFVVVAEPRPWALVVFATISGTSLTALADEGRRALRRDDR